MYDQSIFDKNRTPAISIFERKEINEKENVVNKRNNIDFCIHLVIQQCTTQYNHFNGHIIASSF